MIRHVMEQIFGEPMIDMRKHEIELVAMECRKWQNELRRVDAARPYVVSYLSDEELEALDEARARVLKEVTDHQRLGTALVQNMRELERGLQG